jgi:hypothetical protein
LWNNPHAAEHRLSAPTHENRCLELSYGIWQEARNALRAAA